MKKWGIPLLVTGILLAGCSAPESEAVMESSTAVEVQKESPISRSEFKSGDLIIDMNISYKKGGSTYSADTAYYFGGFIDEDTLVISTNKNDGFDYGVAIPSHFTFEKDSIIVLPLSSTKIKVLDFDIKNNTITLEQLK